MNAETMGDYRDTGAELYHAGRMARIHGEPFDEAKPRPWRLGWQDEDTLQADIAAGKYDEPDTPQEFHPLTREFISRIKL